MNGWLQKVPALSFFERASLHLTKGQQISIDIVTKFLVRNGFHRTETVREYGEFAVRGGILDVFSDASALPNRIDFFGDEIDTIKAFDALSQRSIEPKEKLFISPAAEFLLDEDSIDLFRSRFREFFGGKGAKSPLYEAVSAGHMSPGIEHWSALLHSEMATIEDYARFHCDEMPLLVFDEEAKPAISARLEQITEFYEARQTPEIEEDIPYFPLAPHWHYRSEDDVDNALNGSNCSFLSSFSQDRETQDGFDVKGRAGVTFVANDTRPKIAQIVDLWQSSDNETRYIIARTTKGAVRIGEMLTKAAYYCSFHNRIIRCVKPKNIHLCLASRARILRLNM